MQSFMVQLHKYSYAAIWELNDHLQPFTLCWLKGQSEPKSVGVKVKHDF